MVYPGMKRGSNTKPKPVVYALSGCSEVLPELTDFRKYVWPPPGAPGSKVLPVPTTPVLNNSPRLGARMSSDRVARKRMSLIGVHVAPAFQVVTEPEVL